jgi:hypothetical protein
VAFIFAILTLVFFETVVIFVYSVVGQMHEQIFQIRVGRSAVSVGAEAHNTVFMHVDTQGVHSINHHVNPEVVLEFIHQVGPRQVLLDHHAFFFASCFYDFQPPAKKYSFALTKVIRLHYESLPPRRFRLRLLFLFFNYTLSFFDILVFSLLTTLVVLRTTVSRIELVSEVR